MFRILGSFNTFSMSRCREFSEFRCSEEFKLKQKKNVIISSLHDCNFPKWPIFLFLWRIKTWTSDEVEEPQFFFSFGRAIKETKTRIFSHSHFVVSALSSNRWLFFVVLVKSADNVASWKQQEEFSGDSQFSFLRCNCTKTQKTNKIEKYRSKLNVSRMKGNKISWKFVPYKEGKKFTSRIGQMWRGKN